MSTTWPASVPTVIDGITTFSAAGLNPIITALTERTTSLDERMSTLTGNQGYILPDTGFAPTCEVGMLVAQIPVDTTIAGVSYAAGTYVPAQAGWSDLIRSDGSPVPDPRAYVVGLLITINHTDHSGTILCHGWTTDASVIASLTTNATSGAGQAAPEIGDYYLTTDGRAQCSPTTPQEMSVYCYSYLSSGKLIVRPQLPEYGGHSHSYRQITTTWQSAPTVSASLPAGALYATDISSDSGLVAMLNANPNNMCLVKNGSEVQPSDWGVYISTGADPQYVIYIKFEYLSEDTFTLHAITPFTSNEPIVRSVDVEDGAALLSCSNTKGRVRIKTNFTPSDTTALTGLAVTDISDADIKMGPVIQGLYAGPGIHLNDYNDRGITVPGVKTISASGTADTLYDMNLCNLDGVLLGNSSSRVAYVFPSGTTSALTGTIRVPYHTLNTQTGELLLLVQGTGGVISGLSAQVTVQSLPTATGGNMPIATAVTHTIPSVSAGNTGNYYLCSVSLGTQYLPGNALVICKISAASPTNSLNVLSVSLRLT